MSINANNKDFRFLSGGGEAGELIRNINWGNTALGDIDTWPENLCTTLGIMLHSAFPMFLFWGDELICFYNDAFMVSLGQNGKHPAIGKKGQVVWEEIWDFIGPLITGVMTTGKPGWFEDRLVPFYREEKIEDIYWTFSYSAAYGNDGNVNGVVVTCTETTKTVLAKKKLEESELTLRSMITTAPVSIAIFRGPAYITEMANAHALELWGRKIEDVLNKPIFEAMPELKQQGIMKIMDSVYNNGKIVSTAALQFEITRNGKSETAYINFSYEPVYDLNGNVDGIMAVGSEVTEQVTAHKKVEENEEKLNVVIDASGLGTFELNPATGVFNCSAKFKEIFGYHFTHEVNHTVLLHHVLPQDIAIRNIAFEKALQTGTLNYQCRIKKPGNEIRWIEVKGKTFYDEDKSPKLIIGTCGDITEQNQYRNDLEESEQKFRRLADSMPQHIWTADTEGNLNYFNQSVFNYSGLSLEQINQGGWLQIVHPDDREENVKAWTESIKTGKDFLCEHRFRRHDGIYRWQLSRAIPQKDEHGSIQMWVGSSTDIEEQKNFAGELEKQVRERTAELIQLNETLRKSEERYHLMVAEVQDYAILYLNAEGIVQNWNIGAEKIKGYKASEIIGKSFSNFYTDKDRKDKLPQKLLKMAALNSRAVQEGWRLRKDGTLFWANVVITAVHNSAKEVIGYSKVTHDLTDKKEAADILMEKKIELEHKNIELEKMNKELQSFAYISSHDLQEPLRKIQTFASRIVEKEKGNLSESGVDMFLRMQRSAERMQSLIDDLLAYSRTHTLERDFEKVNIQDIIQKVIVDLKEEIQQKEAIIEIKNSCEVNIIPFQFQQLFYNLISNSLKFSRPDVPLKIIINNERVKGNQLQNVNLKDELTYCHISVEDNGIGFEPEYAERIFELFQRLHGKEKYPGTGIGLAIVKKIVDNHDGIITATGEPGKAARFDIFLPVL